MERKVSDCQGRGNQPANLIVSCFATLAARAVLAKLGEVSQQRKIYRPPEHHFIKADLRLISEAKPVTEVVFAGVY